MAKIINRWNDKIIYQDKFTELRDTVIAAVKAGANLADANLTGANLTRAYLADANLADANLARANLADANLARATLTRANLADANLARATLTRANLARANLARAYLADANLADANLADANLADANLTGAYLADANLTDANLADANLTDANLTRAYLADANLTDANLTRANLTRADLTRATGINYFIVTPLAILNDQPGVIHAYKLVKNNGEGTFNGGIVYEIGQSYAVDNASTDIYEQCGPGINLATLDWCIKNWVTGYRILIAEFNAIDIACIPIASDGKFRVHRCAIVGEKDLSKPGIIAFPVEET